MKFKAYLGCIVTILTLLFASLVFAEGLTLSLSDPELGSFVMEKKNPVKTTCPCGIGGLSVGEFTYEGEWLGVVFHLGDTYPMQFPTPPGKYGCDCLMGFIIYDKDGWFIYSPSDRKTEKLLLSAAKIDLSMEAQRKREAELEKNQQVPLDPRREKMLLGMAALLEKYFDRYPNWRAEMGSLIQQRNHYETTRRALQHAPKVSIGIEN